MSDVIAIACSDIHLCHTCPPARSSEDNWYEAMRRPLDELSELQRRFDCPILCAGDIFDRWNPPPELINFAIQALPKNFIAVPGQHDLPYHDIGSVHKSAFRTLIHAGTVDGLWNEAILEAPSDQFFHILGRGWGEPFETDVDSDDEYLTIALTHYYVGTQTHTYPDAPEESYIRNWQMKLKDYDVAIFGDNHDGFTARVGTCRVVNCGCLIPRKTNERSYQPSVWLIYGDGSVERHYLDTSKDKWVDDDVEEEPDQPIGLNEFIDELEQLNADRLDFRESIERYVEDNEVEWTTKQILLEAMEDK